ncbi:hypothetical protein B0T18DRAFT_431933 [Schizothecium vesticola]|uniref:Uncharacterized protein n=1 Tax=Schizothecium vesticola TaxID=314040 RepID=A0AA40EJT3_9PEZI|nr:hypothetical protein B0T18DRAFT_431933 [Schizothecium vesticola]
MSKWDAQKERDLATAIFTATAPHPAEVKQKIIEMMAEAGHIVNWDATRHKLRNPPSRDFHQHPETKAAKSSAQNNLKPHLQAFTMVRWEDVREDLLDAMLQVSMPLTRDQQDSIVAILNERGHNVTWNAMRYTWDVETNEALLRVMNNHYHPNAADCKAMIGQLNAKGYAFSDSALL